MSIWSFIDRRRYIGDRSLYCSRAFLHQRLLFVIILQFLHIIIDLSHSKSNSSVPSKSPFGASHLWRIIASVIRCFLWINYVFKLRFWDCIFTFPQELFWSHCFILKIHYLVFLSLFLSQVHDLECWKSRLRILYFNRVRANLSFFHVR